MMIGLWVRAMKNLTGMMIFNVNKSAWMDQNGTFVINGYKSVKETALEVDHTVYYTKIFVMDFGGR